MTVQALGFIKTDGGSHPPETWANITADEILGLIQLGPTASQDIVDAKANLRPKLVAIFTQSHTELQNSERAALGKSHKRMNAACDPRPHIEAPLTEFKTIIKDTPFAEHFANPEVLEVVGRMIGHHKATAIHIERSWHADRNKNSPEAKAFRAKNHSPTAIAG